MPKDPWRDLTSCEVKRVCKRLHRDYDSLDNSKQEFLQTCCRSWFNAIRRVRGGVK